MADATCIFSTAPLWTALMAVCMKKVREGGREGGRGGKERTRMLRFRPLFTHTPSFLPSLPPSLPQGTWSRFDTLAAICCSVGVLLVLKPGPLSSSPSLPPSTLPTGASTPVYRNTAFGIFMAVVSAVTTGKGGREGGREGEVCIWMT